MRCTSDDVDDELIESIRSRLGEGLSTRAIVDRALRELDRRLKQDELADMTADGGFARTDALLDPSVRARARRRVAFDPDAATFRGGLASVRVAT
ncbi:hypothetical protein GII33_13260 [Gordonia pseudamarae]|jgi:hypothetical protein|uniref:hypothetical protein n=1 Tax=Gordonia TaxID=2053 RepID=UPI0019827837|nr:MULTISPECIES: hypothetical protein [Gordonia]MBD0022673.1 hypothetical protein [Gordonia sp. (in: high G+C Gram-positive bacteria)]QHN26778.1 hypothetical protein GII33_13260 [Gordonia pseudamarae]